MDHTAGTEKRLRRRGWSRFSRNTWITIGIIVLVLVVARLALPYVLRRAINSRLEKIPDYTGWVGDVHVGLWRGAYTLKGLVVQKRNGVVKEPYFRADEIDFSVAWRELWHHHLVADIALQKPMLTLIAGPSVDVTQIAVDNRWHAAINDIFPIDITWIKITDGQLRYINHNTKPPVDIRVAHVKAVATGLRNRPDDTGSEFPATLVLEGVTIGDGVLKMAAHAEPLAVQPHFLLKLEIEKVSLPSLNEFLRAYAGIDVSKGTFSGYMEVVAREGHYKGYFKPFFDQVDFAQPPGEHRNLKQEIWEWFVSSFATIFKNHPRDEVATKIPFEGEVKNLNVEQWKSFVNLLRHAFVQPLAKKLDTKAPGGAGAKDEKGLLDKGNEKKEEKGTEKVKEPEKPSGH